MIGIELTEISISAGAAPSGTVSPPNVLTT